MKTIGKFLFKFRSYTPLPFVFIMIYFMHPNILSIVFGFLTVASGELIRICAVSYAGSETRTTESVGGTQLVTQGPFAYVRNPLYIGNILIYCGIGIMSLTLFPYLQIFAFLFFLFQYYCIILNEEEYLRNTFGETFKLYYNSVSRFIPSFKQVPDSIKSNLEYDLKSGLKSEKRTFQSIFILTSLIIIYFVYNLSKQ